MYVPALKGTSVNYSGNSLCDEHYIPALYGVLINYFGNYMHDEYTSKRFVSYHLIFKCELL